VGAVIAIVSVVIFVLWMRSGPLTAEYANASMGADPDLEFAFRTGPENPERLCSDIGMPDASEEKTRIAISVGWLDRRCENHQIYLRLTAEGVRRSVLWGMSGDAPGMSRTPEDDHKWTSWFVKTARFERVGPLEIRSTESPNWKQVIVHGVWVPNEEGRLLQRAGWRRLFRTGRSDDGTVPAERVEEFEISGLTLYPMDIFVPLSRWKFRPHLLGIELDLIAGRDTSSSIVVTLRVSNRMP
jgi:hypothetical protein